MENGEFLNLHWGASRDDIMGDLVDSDHWRLDGNTLNQNPLIFEGTMFERKTYLNCHFGNKTYNEIDGLREIELRIVDKKSSSLSPSVYGFTKSLYEVIRALLEEKYGKESDYFYGDEDQPMAAWIVDGGKTVVQQFPAKYEHYGEKFNTVEIVASYNGEEVYSQKKDYFAEAREILGI